MDWIITAQRHIDLSYTRPRRKNAVPGNRADYQYKYNRTYREKHSNLVECPCGQVFKETSRYAHIQSKKHTNYISNNI